MTAVTVPSFDVVSITAGDIAVVVSLAAARAGDAAKVIAALLFASSLHPMGNHCPAVLWRCS